MPFATTRMDLEIIILREVSETEKDKYHMISHIWNLIKMIQNNLFIKQKQTLIFKNQIYGYQRGNRDGEG